jgi:futalosine hydrolase
LRLLVVTAVTAEEESVARGLGCLLEDSGTRPVPGGRLRRLDRPGPPSGGLPPGLRSADLLAAGVGPAAAAAGAAAALTGAALAGEPYGLVISAGIGGGFVPTAPVGSVVVADVIVAADLGAETAEGFTPVTELGFGTVEHRPPEALSRAAAQAVGAVYAPVLTVSTVTGTAGRAAALAARHPRAAAEAMEGFGVAEAAAAHRTAVLEIRAISNPVGPRDRANWQIGRALTELTDAFGKLVPVLDTLDAPDALDALDAWEARTR